MDIFYLFIFYFFAGLVWEKDYITTLWENKILAPQETGGSIGKLFQRMSLLKTSTAGRNGCERTCINAGGLGGVSVCVLVLSACQCVSKVCRYTWICMHISMCPSMCVCACCVIESSSGIMQAHKHSDTMLLTILSRA